MIANYIKVSLRNLWKHKGSNLLNLLGLAFGIACCALCYLHIRYELSFDQFNTHHRNIYRLVAGNPRESDYWVKVAAPMPPVLHDNIPGVEDYVRFNSVSYNPRVSVGFRDETFLEPYFMMADPSFFKVFTFETWQGDPLKTLSDLNGVVITRRIARKLFGNESALGKVIQLKDDSIDFQVGAVVEDPPAQSHITFDYLVSFENLDRIFGAGSSQSWGQFNWYGYLLLNDKTNPEEVQAKIQAFTVKLPDSKEQAFNELYLQPMDDIHFQYNRGNLRPSYDKKYILVFLTIAISLLLVATINYVNLSIALSIRRIKEIGVRKSIGATREQLIFQYIQEGVVVSLLALIVGMVMLKGLLPRMNDLFGSSIQLEFTDRYFLLLVMGITLIIGLFSGSYLAFYVNRFKASHILKGGIGKSTRGMSLQQALIFIQFGISVILIVCSFIISSQMNFMQHRDLGFNHSQVISVPLPAHLSSTRIEELKNQLRQSPDVADVSACSFTPGKANWHQTVWWEGQTEPFAMFIISGDHDFVRTLQMNLVEGDPELIARSDQTQYILNTSALKAIGWDTGLGKSFSPFGERQAAGIAGVVSDFNFMSLHHEVGPLVLVIGNQFSHDQLLVRTTGDNFPSALSQVETIYKRNLVDAPFEFTFMDDTLQQLYQSEGRVQQVVSYLTAIAVFFALVGVYGLISFSIENKTREIAIRKVLGVTPADLILLFSKRYYILVLFAFGFAIPVIWSVMSSWLENFNYRVGINPWWFVISLLLVVVAISAIGVLKYLSLRKINPALALKNE